MVASGAGRTFGWMRKRLTRESRGDLHVFAEMDCNSSKVFSVVISLDSEGHPLTAKTPAKLAGWDSTGGIRKTADTSQPTRGQARRSTGRAQPDLRSGRPG